MKEIVTGYGNSVVLGHFVNNNFKSYSKFPRKMKKALKKEMPWLTFHKNQLDYVIDKCVHKDWLADDRSFALIISKESNQNEKHIYFCPYLSDTEEITERHIFYKRENFNPIKNL